MISQGSYKLAWQHGTWALYAEASVEVEDSGHDGIELTKVAEQWRPGVLFGVLLAREALWRSPGVSAATIRIRVFRGQPCDTTMMAAAFAAFHATVQALNGDAGDAFRFDESTGDFFVKTRTRDR